MFSQGSGVPRPSQPPSCRAPARNSDLCVGRSKRNFLHNVSFSAFTDSVTSQPQGVYFSFSYVKLSADCIIIC